MSSKRISIVHRVDGQHVDYDATPVLRDPTAAYGVKRVDTGEVVVAAGAAFTRDGTGLYSFDVDGLTPGAAYLAYVERAYLGATKRDAYPFTAAASDATYGTRAGIENLYGSDNVAAWADLNNNGDAGEIAARIQWARQQAYRWINSHLRGAGLTAPATGTDDFSEYELLADVEAERAGAVLYFSRGLQQQQSPEGMDGAMQGHYDHAEAELLRLIGVVQATDADDATAPAGTFQFVAVRRAGYVASGDEYAGN